MRTRTIRKRKNKKDLKLEDIKKLIIERKTAIEISLIYNCSPDDIYNLLKKFNTTVAEIRRFAPAAARGVYPCGIPYRQLQICRTQCYLAPKCPAAEAAGNVRGIPHPKDERIRGENQIFHKIKLGHENAFLVKNGKE